MAVDTWTETCNGADHDPFIGDQTWTIVENVGGLSFRRASNQLRATSGGSGSTMRCETDLTSVDHSLVVPVGASGVQEFGSHNEWGCCVRMDASALTYYLMRAVMSGGVVMCNLHYRLAGAARVDLVTSRNSGIAIGSMTSFGLSIVGSTLQMLVNGNPVGADTVDTHVTTGVRQGMFMRTPDGNGYFDNIVATVAAAPPPAASPLLTILRSSQDARV